MIREMKRREYHGLSKTKVYRARENLILRCDDRKSRSYRSHGGRGIRYEPKWKDSFVAFLEDVGLPPSPNHSLDRFPNPNGHYVPGNVRWATLDEQELNKTRKVTYPWRGKDQDLMAWHRELGIPYHTLRKRLRMGWSIEEAFSTPKGKWQRRKTSLLKCA